MRRNKATFIGLVIALVVVAVWSALHYRSRQINSDNLEWMQMTSGVRLPRGIRDVSIYDNGEMFVTAHVLLPSGTVNDFARKFGFAPISGAQSRLFGMDQLDERFRKIPQGADLVAYAGRSQKQTWIFVLDKRSGHLWFTVQYPDFAGDPP